MITQLVYQPSPLEQYQHLESSDQRMQLLQDRIGRLASNALGIDASQPLQVVLTPGCLMLVDAQNQQYSLTLSREEIALNHNKHKLGTADHQTQVDFFFIKGLLDIATPTLSPATPLSVMSSPNSSTVNITINMAPVQESSASFPLLAFQHQLDQLSRQIETGSHAEKVSTLDKAPKTSAAPVPDTLQNVDDLRKRLDHALQEIERLRQQQEQEQTRQAALIAQLEELNRVVEQSTKDAQTIQQLEALVQT